MAAFQRGQSFGGLRAYPNDQPFELQPFTPGGYSPGYDGPGAFPQNSFGLDGYPPYGTPVSPHNPLPLGPDGYPLGPIGGHDNGPYNMHPSDIPGEFQDTGMGYPGGPVMDYNGYPIDPGGVYPIDLQRPSRHGKTRHRRKRNAAVPTDPRYHRSLKEAVADKLKTGVSIIKALVARSMFAVHSSLVVWRVVDVVAEDWCWMLLGLLGLLFIETFVTVCLRKGREGKWFSICTFLFLCAAVPGLWLLEFDRLDRYKTAVDNETIAEEAQSLSTVKGIHLPVILAPDLWVLALEQMLLFVLIIARWILPKGGISRSQLSLLLLVYIGMASDIMDVFVLFEEPEVLHDTILGYVILGVWSFSLVQFCMVLTVTKAPRSRAAQTRPDDPHNRPGCLCCETEIWSLLTTIFMQDGPFLGVRLWVMIKYKTLNYSLLFFSFKNFLVIVLQIYRMVIVVAGVDDDDDEARNRPPSNRRKHKSRRRSW